MLLYTLPFHGRRAERGSPFSGYGYFAHGFAGFAEAMAQAVHDFRSVMDYLEFTGVDRIALTGMSLGDYTSALIACVDDRIQAVIPNVPVVTPDRTVEEWFPANHVVRLRSVVAGTENELTRDATMYASPLNYPPLVPKDRRLIITGLGDRLAPPEQAELLWEAPGPLRVALVPGQSHLARQSTGLPTPHDPIHGRFHVCVSVRASTGRRNSLNRASERGTGLASSR